MKKVSLWLIGLMFSTLFVTQADTVFAESNVYGLANVVNGEVYYQKGSSYREILLEQQDKIYPGDIITTSNGASVELYVPTTGDTFYISEESEVFFTFENEHLSVHVLQGNLFVTAEKRSTDEEALYIISASKKYEVLGTTFNLHVDPVSGSTSVFVFSGVVQANVPNVLSSPALIHPGTQQITNGTESLVQIINPEMFASLESTNIIKNIIENNKRINEENEEFLAGLESNPLSEDTSLDMDNYVNNVNTLLPAILQSQIDVGTISEPEVEQLIEDANTSINLKDADRYQLGEQTAQQKKQLEMIRELERKRRMQQEMQEQKQREEAQQHNQNFLNQIKQSMDTLNQQNQVAMERKQQDAMDRYLDQIRPPVVIDRPQPQPDPNPDPNPQPDPEPEYEVFEVTASLDGHYYIRFEDYFANNLGYQYELLINGEIVSPISEINGEYHVEPFQLQPGDNKIEVYSYKDGEKVGYGSTQETIEFDEEGVPQ